MQGVKKLTSAPPTPTFHYLLYSQLKDDERSRVHVDVRALLNDIHPGLDTTAEFDHVISRGYGEVLLVLKNETLVRQLPAE